MQAGARELIALSAAERRLAQELWRAALEHRGGAELFEDVAKGRGLEEFLDDLLEAGALWSFTDERGLRLAYAVLHDGVVVFLYVRPEFRRRGVGREFLTSLTRHGARDGLALPGDRATKSLYESVGWKARLLTMRGD
ncbi:MAG: GNAT family N-acetyltransferase [Acidimicrobiaceae bacterium]|nr:GNAT family N-acetyltransferase [Acidimicrobiaceae bacterium]